MQHAFSVDDFVGGFECFAADAIPTGVRALIKIIGIACSDSLDERCDACLVMRTGRANELIVADVQALPRLLKPIGNFVDEHLRRNAALYGGLLHFVTVFVHSHEEMHVVTAKPVVSGNNIGADFLEGVADVWIAVRVIDGGGEIEALH